jgi:hypothetical protein
MRDVFDAIEFAANANLQLLAEVTVENGKKYYSLYIQPTKTSPKVCCYHETRSGQSYMIELQGKSSYIETDLESQLAKLPPLPPAPKVERPAISPFTKRDDIRESWQEKLDRLSRNK